jgi:integrase
LFSRSYGLPYPPGLEVGTGIRWGECVGRRWDVIDLEKRLIRVTTWTAWRQMSSV